MVAADEGQLDVQRVGGDADRGADGREGRAVGGADAGRSIRILHFR